MAYNTVSTATVILPTQEVYSSGSSNTFHGTLCKLVLKYLFENPILFHFLY